ncbi:hypothetical protein CAPTEDRAFT_170418 [Capitella teleta]|uniref:EGF-like domain-containing protein n=1 Tax=Capitella teleta TaxID=283909 RepID=R7VAM9_CAPTE|nr:hypothetical protein CAPTEDRAFT_170418 [Capitella teleta]|eukprot:ELU12745.1 hypothetical protein CAPTEDRAFT_170418 [Capitella teleta]
MECLNRELINCDEETVTIVKKQVLDLETKYKDWLVTERLEDETCFDACSSSPCENHGICVLNETLTDGFYCKCIEGFEGEFCEIHKCQEISQCDPNPCKNHATCIEPEDGSYGYTCKCLPGYTGAHCDIDIIDPCVGLSCDHICLRDAAICSCHLGYTLAADGSTCLDVNECVEASENLCDANSTCSNIEGSYECVCKESNMMLECTSYCSKTQPCQNDGVCLDGAYGSFTCVCSDSFTGEFCQFDINECETDKHGCSHFCENFEGGYQCGCHSGYALEEDRQTCVGEFVLHDQFIIKNADYMYADEDKVTITTTVGRHVVLKMAIKTEWQEDLKDMNSVVAALWSSDFEKLVRPSSCVHQSSLQFSSTASTNLQKIPRCDCLQSAEVLQIKRRL